MTDLKETGAQPDKSAQQTRLRVVIADPDPLARRVVRDLLQENQSKRFIVPGEAATGTEAIELGRYYRPDVVTLEADMGDMPAAEATRRLLASAPSVRVLIFSRAANPDLQLDALAAGASGYVEKCAGLDELAIAIEAVADGEAVIPRHTVTRLIARLRTLPDGGAGMRPVRSPLTQREWEILDLMSQGMDTQEMADTLVLSAETIYSHVKRILNKLGVHCRNDAIAAARRLRDPFALQAEADAVGELDSRERLRRAS